LNKRLRCEGHERYRTLLRPGVIGRHRQHQLVRYKAIIEHLRVLHIRSHDPEFKIATDNLFDGIHGIGDAQDDSNVRVLALKMP
jgi:hypothetical protein